MSHIASESADDLMDALNLQEDGDPPPLPPNAPGPNFLYFSYDNVMKSKYSNVTMCMQSLTATFQSSRLARTVEASTISQSRMEYVALASHISSCISLIQLHTAPDMAY